MFHQYQDITSPFEKFTFQRGVKYKFIGNAISSVAGAVGRAIGPTGREIVGDVAPFASFIPGVGQVLGPVISSVGNKVANPFGGSSVGLGRYGGYYSPYGTYGRSGLPRTPPILGINAGRDFGSFARGGFNFSDGGFDPAANDYGLDPADAYTDYGDYNPEGNGYGLDPNDYYQDQGYTPSVYDLGSSGGYTGAGTGYTGRPTQNKLPWWLLPAAVGIGATGAFKGKAINPIALPSFAPEDKGYIDTLLKGAAGDIGRTGYPYIDQAASAFGENTKISPNPYTEGVVRNLSEDFTNQLNRGLASEDLNSITRGLRSSSMRAPQREHLALESARQFGDIAGRLRAQDYEASRGRQLQAGYGLGGLQQLIDSLKSGATGRLIAGVGAKRPTYITPGFGPSDASQNLAGIGQLIALMKGGVF